MPEICYPCPRSDLLPMLSVRTHFSLDSVLDGVVMNGRDLPQTGL